MLEHLKHLNGRLGETDRGVLEALSGKEGMKALEKATPFRVKDDGAYRTYRQIITAAGARPLNNEEFLQAIEEYVGATEEFTGESNPQLLEIFLSE